MFFLIEITAMAHVYALKQCFYSDLSRIMLYENSILHYIHSVYACLLGAAAWEFKWGGLVRAVGIQPYGPTNHNNELKGCWELRRAAEMGAFFLRWDWITSKLFPIWPNTLMLQFHKISAVVIYVTFSLVYEWTVVGREGGGYCLAFCFEQSDCNTIKLFLTEESLTKLTDWQYNFKFKTKPASTSASTLKVSHHSTHLCLLLWFKIRLRQQRSLG